MSTCIQSFMTGNQFFQFSHLCMKGDTIRSGDFDLRHSRARIVLPPAILLLYLDLHLQSELFVFSFSSFEYTKAPLGGLMCVCVCVCVSKLNAISTQIIDAVSCVHSTNPYTIYHTKY